MSYTEILALIQEFQTALAALKGINFTVLAADSAIIQADVTALEADGAAVVAQGEKFISDVSKIIADAQTEIEAVKDASTH